MFKQIRYRLLWSYLLVFTSILVIFAVGVRIIFARSLTKELINNLTALGQGASANVEFEHNHLKIESDFASQNLIDQNQALQWFDKSGNLIYQQGKYIINLPLSSQKYVQIKIGKIKIQGVTLPIISSDNGELIGYIRVSQSLLNFDENLQKLDWGLGLGIVFALLASGIGGIILTQQAMKPIEESFERLKQFTADASHELRSPLMAIKSNGAVAMKYPEGMRKTDEEKFEAIASATNQMTRLTEDLLLLARTEKINKKLQNNIDLKIILEDLIKLYQPQLFSKEINLKINLNQSLFVTGDSAKLTRLFGNLIENALHYTPSKGAIYIESKAVNSSVYIKIEDTGIGISPKNLDKVFERFWRENKSRSYNSGGSGLGLAIVKAIATEHHGSITVTSKLEVGSCFTVCLPIRQ